MLFLAYLWGIETLYANLYHQDGNLHVSSVPMRNWNQYLPALLQYLPAFLAYLWGIETKKGGTNNVRVREVSSVPMRNWNISLEYASNSTCSFVSSVPMRNWNIGRHPLHFAVHPTFLAYLWGIETERAQTAKPPALPVSSVPMRNWNNFIDISPNDGDWSF